MRGLCICTVHCIHICIHCAFVRFHPKISIPKGRSLHKAATGHQLLNSPWVELLRTLCCAFLFLPILNIAITICAVPGGAHARVAHQKRDQSPGLTFNPPTDPIFAALKWSVEGRVKLPTLWRFRRLWCAYEGLRAESTRTYGQFPPPRTES